MLRAEVQYLRQPTGLPWLLTTAWKVEKPTYVDFLSDHCSEHPSPFVKRTLDQDCVVIASPNTSQLIPMVQPTKLEASSSASPLILPLKVNRSVGLEDVYLSTSAEFVAAHEDVSFTESHPMDNPLVTFTDSRCEI